MKGLSLLLLFTTIGMARFAQGQNADAVQPALEVLLNYTKVRDFALATSGNEAYVTIQSPLEEVSVIACLKKKNGNWLEPEIARFSGKYKDLEPFLSPDNKRLYLVSNRPVIRDSLATKDYDIWYVERSNLESPWSEPVNLGQPVNTKHDEFYPSVASSGNLYFTRNSPDSKFEDDIFLSLWKNGSYKEPTPLSDSINTASYEFNAFVAPDESFLMFSGYNRDDGLGSGDLYISYRDKNGNWFKAANAGDAINSKHMDYCPFVDMASGTLYFTSRRSNLSPTQIKTTHELRSLVNSHENGLSRIYKVSAKKIIIK